MSLRPEKIFFYQAEIISQEEKSTLGNENLSEENSYSIFETYAKLYEEINGEKASELELETLSKVLSGETDTEDAFTLNLLQTAKLDENPNEISNEEYEILHDFLFGETNNIETQSNEYENQQYEVLAQTYLGKSASECTKEELTQAYSISIMENIALSSQTSLDNQDLSDGFVSEMFDAFKQTNDIDLTQTTVQKAINEQVEMIEILKQTLQNGGDFEAKYKELTGVEFNAEKIAIFQEKQSQLQFVQLGFQKIDSFCAQLKQAKIKNDETGILNAYIDFYGEEKGKQEFCEMYKNFCNNYPHNPPYCTNPFYSLENPITNITLNENNEYIITRKNGLQGNIGTVENSTLLQAFSSVITDYFKEDKINEYLGNLENSTGINYQNLIEEYNKISGEALGKANNVSTILNEYISSQEGFIDGLASASQIGGMTLMAIGGVATLCPLTAPAGPAILGYGQVLAIGGTFGDEILETADTITNENSFEKDKEKYKEILKETLTDSALFAAGYGIGNISSNVADDVLSTTGKYVFNQTGNEQLARLTGKLLSVTSEIGVDGTLSLLSDMVITGEIITADSASMETFSQLLGILTGTAFAKINNTGKTDIDINTTKQNSELPTTSSSLDIESGFARLSDGTTSIANTANIESKAAILKQLSEDYKLYGSTTDLNTLSYDELKIVLKFAQQGITNADDLYSFAKLQGTQLDNAFKFVELGVNGYSLCELAKIEDTTTAIEFTKLGIKDSTELLYISRLEEPALTNARRFANLGVDKDFYSLSRLSGEQLDFAFELAELGAVSTDGYTYLSELATKAENREIVIEFAKYGIKDTSELFDISKIQETQLNTAREFAKAGVKWNYSTLLNLAPEQLDNALKFAQLGVVNRYDLSSLAELEGPELELAFKFAECKMKIGIDQLVSLEGTDLENALKFAKAGVKDGFYIRYSLINLKASEMETALKFADIGIQNGIDLESLSKLSGVQLETALKFAENGITSRENLLNLSLIPNEQIDSTLLFIKENNEQGKLSTTKIQGSNNVILSYSKTSETTPIESDNIVESSTSVTKTISLLEDGTTTRSTTYTYADGSNETWYYGSDSTTIISYDAQNTQNLNYQIEIKNNIDGSPIEIIYTKPAEALSGAFEVSTYKLSDYPEDFNILAALKDGSIDRKLEEANLPPGQKTSEVITGEDGSTTYQENHLRNGNASTRNYVQHTDEAGNITSTEYKYEIKNQDGSTLLALDRNWTKNTDGTTTTVINGKTYTTSFDDTIQEIKITQEDGTITTIPIGEICADQSEYDKDTTKIIMSEYGSFEAANKAFFEYCKTLPADKLLAISETTNKIFITSNLKSASGGGMLITGLNLSITSHELGHSIDFKGIGLEEKGHINHAGNIATNKDLINTYQEEFLAFKKDYPEVAQEMIKYFSQSGGGDSDTGLNEFIAEVNMLMTTYGISCGELNIRSEYLVKYFPETIAKIGNLLGFNG